MYPKRDERALTRRMSSSCCKQIERGVPSPKVSGARRIIRFLDMPARWYIARTHARKTTSSVTGPCDTTKGFKMLENINCMPGTYNTIISDPLDGEVSQMYMGVP